MSASTASGLASSALSVGSGVATGVGVAGGSVLATVAAAGGAVEPGGESIKELVNGIQDYLE